MSSTSLNSTSRLTPIETPEVDDSVLDLPSAVAGASSIPSQEYQIENRKPSGPHEHMNVNGDAKSPSCYDGNTLRHSIKAVKTKFHEGLVNETGENGETEKKGKIAGNLDEIEDDDEETEEDDETTEEDHEDTDENDDKDAGDSEKEEEMDENSETDGNDAVSEIEAKSDEEGREEKTKPFRFDDKKKQFNNEEKKNERNQNNLEANEVHRASEDINDVTAPNVTTNNADQHTNSAIRFESLSAAKLPTKTPFSSKSRHSITSTTSSRSSTADRATSKETLDDVLARETLDDSMSLKSNPEVKKEEISLSKNETAEEKTESSSPIINCKLDGELHHKVDHVKEIDFPAGKSGKLDSQAKTSNSDLLISRASEQKTHTPKLDNSQNENQSNQDCVKQVSPSQNKVDEQTETIEETDIEGQSNIFLLPKEPIENESVELEKEQDSFFKSSTNTADISRPEEKFPQNLTTSVANHENTRDQNVEKYPHDSRTEFDDPVEFSYFAMFKPNATAHSRPDQNAFEASQTMDDRPVVQNIVEDFYSDSQTNKISHLNPVSSSLSHREEKQSISLQNNIDYHQQNNPSKFIPGKEGPEKELQPTFDDSPMNNTEKVELDLDRKSIPQEALLDEQKHESNYGATPEFILAGTGNAAHKSLITINDSKNHVKPRQISTETFVGEPLLQVIDRNISVAMAENVPITENIESEATNQTSSVKNISDYEMVRSVNKKPVKTNKSPKKSNTQSKSKYSSYTLQPFQELKAIDRILQGPYSKSVRSPREKVTTPWNTQRKSDKNERNKQKSLSRSQNHDAIVNGARKSKQSKPKHEVSKRKPVDIKKLNTRNEQETDITVTDKKVLESDNIKEEKMTGFNVDKITTDIEQPSETDSKSQNEQEIVNSLPKHYAISSENNPQETIEPKHVETEIEMVNFNDEQYFDSSKLDTVSSFQTPIIKNEEAMSQEKNESEIEKKDSKTGEATLNVNIDQNSEIIQKDGKENYLNGGIAIANSFVENEIPAEQHRVPETSPQSLDKNSYEGDSNCEKAPPTTSIDANNITITTTLVSPSSSKSDVNEVVLDKVVLQPPAKSDKVKPVLKRSKAAPNVTATPTTLIIEDETANIDRSTKPKAGQIILNSIQKKIRENDLASSLNSTSPLPIQGAPHSPSPENSLGNSGPFKAGILRPATKTTSMSSLTVPQGVTGGIHTPSPDEDTFSLASRRDSNRPSFDAMSRRSVDYRIRTTATVIQVGGETEKSRSMLTRDESYIKSAIPYLPLSLAVTCLVLNVFFPGLGTILSGVSLLCCGQTRQSNKSDQTLNIMCANCMVGIAQLFTVTFMLVGWFWAIGWGIHLVSLSVQQRQAMKEQRAKELQALALSAFGSGSPKRTNLFGTG